ncbi:Uncharacterized protein FWK35_00021236 [Aphis craccivora]|uniref:Pre-C2HC domain-containing protein n=1 Tax=Aphis craccivora TaxID=307492 RepID=A0A6G0YDR4_APHCR|nr:Uncharacterized protein FWK35_00021236 [Aphis craccivora]
MSLPNKNKTVSPLIIPKSRIQSVPNQSTENILEDNSNEGWIPNTDFNLTFPNASSKSNKQFITPNRFALFSVNQHLIHQCLFLMSQWTIPSLFQNFHLQYPFCSTIHSVTNGEAFTCKSSTNGLKLSTSTPTSYKNDSKADFHTYQPKQERVYRIVVRNLHHTTSNADIEQELLSHDHTVRNITNVLQRTKRKTVFVAKTMAVQNLIVIINCVRCGEQHLSETCQKPTNQPPKCSFRHSGPRNQKLSIKNVSLNTVSTISNSHSCRNTSYAPVKKDNGSSPHLSSTNNTDELSLKISSFLDDLKKLINSLISLLTKVIN